MQPSYRRLLWNSRPGSTSYVQGKLFWLKLKCKWCCCGVISTNGLLRWKIAVDNNTFPPQQPNSVTNKYISRRLRWYERKQETTLFMILPCLMSTVLFLWLSSKLKKWNVEMQSSYVDRTWINLLKRQCNDDKHSCRYSLSIRKFVS